MGNTTAYELQLLRPIESLISTICNERQDSQDICRRLLIQAAAARISGISFYSLLQALGDDARDDLASSAWDCSDKVAAALCNTPIQPALAVASLIGSDLDHMERRRSGSYFTDFRLSTFLMKRLASKLPRGSCIVDPAAGNGSFLVAFALESTRCWNTSVSEVTRQCLYGADMSSAAIKATIWSLAAAGSDIKSLESLRSHLLVVDSLARGRDLWDKVTDGFDAVVGNPPWEKLKLTRHEFLKGIGIERHYGDIYDSGDSLGAWNEKFVLSKNSLEDYKRLLRLKYKLQGDGEDDLYKLFLELSLSLVKSNGGYISMLLPAGLIRSSGAKDLRSTLFGSMDELEITIFFNRPRFFDIDTRFKFIGLEARTGAKYKPIFLSVGSANLSEASSTNRVTINRSELAAIRGDLAIPEIRSQSEWALFQHLYHVGNPLGSKNSPWNLRIVREIDMTRDRHHFSTSPGLSMLPVIEGRMVHQYRHNAKAHLGGTGRKARWLPLASEYPCEIRPQFWFPEYSLKEEIRSRVQQDRVGFCDVTGQTNERTLLAAPIPVGIVCGNKVPTITFSDSPEWLRWTWLAYANSLLLDWVLRRIVTTSLNYFIIKSLPFPSPTALLEHNVKLASLSKRLSCRTHFQAEDLKWSSPQETAEVRAEIEWRVLDVYGLDASVLSIILVDFPLLDRGEPPLEGENQSTVTADLVALRAMQNLGGKLYVRGRLLRIDELEIRVRKAIAQGAIAFRPSQLSLMREKQYAQT